MTVLNICKTPFEALFLGVSCISSLRSVLSAPLIFECDFFTVLLYVFKVFMVQTLCVRSDTVSRRSRCKISTPSATQSSAINEPPITKYE